MANIRRLNDSVVAEDLETLEAMLLNSDVREAVSKISVWPEKQSPLHAAVNLGRSSMVLPLLNAGVPVNSFDSHATALHLAVLRRNAAAVRLLLSRGANPDLIATSFYWDDDRAISGRVQDWANKVGFNFNEVRMSVGGKNVEEDFQDFLSPRDRKETELKNALAILDNIEECNKTHERKKDGNRNALTELDRRQIQTNKRLDDRRRAEEREWALKRQRAEAEWKRKRAEWKKEKSELKAELIRIRKVADEEKNRENAELETEKKRVLRDQTAEEDQYDEQMRRWRSMSDYRSEGQILKMTEELEVLNLGGGTDLDGNGNKANGNNDGERSCQICLSKPEQVFTCDICNNWICQNCQLILRSCPMCRTDLERRPLRRNRALERFILFNN